MRYITVTPAYGRDYKFGKDANADWLADKDFTIQDYSLSGYINRSQAMEQGFKVTLRFSKMTKTAQAK